MITAVVDGTPTEIDAIEVVLAELLADDASMRRVEHLSGGGVRLLVESGWLAGTINHATTARDAC